MRTGLFLLAGFLLLAVVRNSWQDVLGQLSGGRDATAVVAFVALWLLVAAFNMWTGVAKAGYSAAEELPVFALIFLVPAVAAVLLKWRVL